MRPPYGRFYRKSLSENGYLFGGKVTRHSFTAEELQCFENNPGNQLQIFYKLWVRKEAYIKGLGLGVKVPLKSFSVPTHLREGYLGEVIITGQPVHEEARNWHIYSLSSLNCKDYCAALATSIYSDNITVKNFNVSFLRAIFPSNNKFYK